MSDQCKHCVIRRDIKLCKATECFHHENWYALEQAKTITKLREENERLKTGLQFYADEEHLYGGLSEFVTADWDTCSGEPGNWWFPPADRDEPIGIEDGSIAKHVLSGGVFAAGESFKITKEKASD